ncbi:MAG: CDP-alcohol phosphatidyltransferase family protein [Chlamydiae bacterium]|nr:CDP-alcohol phosphatidyltransferase family protein [Chlamydiota bacterium]
MNFPLCLTLSRIFLGPLFIAIYLYHQEMGISFPSLPYVLLALVSISELSDILDGFLARKYGKVTDLGKILDPMADSIFRFSILFAFTKGVLQLPILLVIVFFYRDAIISALRTLCALRGFALAARTSGKVKAILLAAVAFFLLILMIPYSVGAISLATLRSLSLWAVSLTALYVVYTGIEYVYVNRHYIRKALQL